MAYHLYQVEQRNQQISKEKSKKFMKDLLEDIIPQLGDTDLIQKIKLQLDKY
jgi:hypothetical protein